MPAFSFKKHKAGKMSEEQKARDRIVRDVIIEAAESYRYFKENSPKRATPTCRDALREVKDDILTLIGMYEDYGANDLVMRAAQDVEADTTLALAVAACE